MEFCHKFPNLFGISPDFQMSLSNSLTFPGQRQPCTYLILLKTGLDLTLKNGFLDARLKSNQIKYIYSLKTQYNM